MIICSMQGRNPDWKRANAGLSSFSLVEVVIAIGVASFVLISILGMMSYAGQTVATSDKYTRLANVASQALATAGSLEFVNSPYGQKLFIGGAITKYSITNYYTFEGLPTNTFNGTVPYFQVVIADAGSTGIPVIANQQLMEPLQIVIMWPKPATGSVFANTNILVSSVLNYESL